LIRSCCAGLVSGCWPMSPRSSPRPPNGRRWRRRRRGAQRDRFLTLTPVGEGGVRVAGRLGVEAAAVVTAALDPLCAPGRDERTPGQRRADALVEVCRLALAAGELPDNGGDRPQVVVTVPFDPLMRALGTGWLDTGTALPRATVRRMACDAKIPARGAGRRRAGP
jgi:hypothetical protein